jgi:hypothetical protein
MSPRQLSHRQAKRLRLKSYLQRKLRPSLRRYAANLSTPSSVWRSLPACAEASCWRCAGKSGSRRRRGARRAGLRRNAARFKAPKTKHGRRTISLPPSAVRDLEQHRRRQLEIRMKRAPASRETTRLCSVTMKAGHLGATLSARDRHRRRARGDVPRDAPHPCKRAYCLGDRRCDG